MIKSNGTMKEPPQKKLRKILILDDEESLLYILARALRGPQVEVLKTSRIEEAEYAIKHTAIDVVIADIRLSGVQGRLGLELLPYVKEHSPQSAIIIMTAYGDTETERSSYEQGAFYYFNKPIDIEVLRRKIQELNIYIE